MADTDLLYKSQIYFMNLKNKIEQGVASPLSSRKPIAYRTPKPAIRKIRKVDSSTKKKKSDIEKPAKVKNMVAMYERFANGMEEDGVKLTKPGCQECTMFVKRKESRKN